MEYLESNKYLPLVLGGDPTIGIYGYTDASVGTGPKGRSVVANAMKLNPLAGAISPTSHATSLVHLSSFESELDGAVELSKKAQRIKNILEELRIKFQPMMNLYSDNEAMVEFIKGKGVAKGVRHMELRMWYIREQFRKGGMLFTHMSGKTIPVDHLTKLATAEDHRIFCHEILGLGLLDEKEIMQLELMMNSKKQVHH
jgi:hypothetical protein